MLSCNGILSFALYQNLWWSHFYFYIMLAKTHICFFFEHFIFLFIDMTDYFICHFSNLFWLNKYNVNHVPQGSNFSCRQWNFINQFAITGSSTNTSGFLCFYILCPLHNLFIIPPLTVEQQSQQLRRFISEGTLTLLLFILYWSWGSTVDMSWRINCRMIEMS